jgi:hypothetical protein
VSGRPVQGDWLSHHSSYVWAGRTHFQWSPPVYDGPTLFKHCYSPRWGSLLSPTWAQGDFCTHVTPHTAHVINTSLNYIKTKIKGANYLLSCQVWLLRNNSVNKYCEVQKTYDRHNSAFRNPAEKKKQRLSTTQQQYPSTIQHTEFFSFLNLWNTSPFLNWSVQHIFSILSRHHILELYRYFRNCSNLYKSKYISNKQ